MKGHSLIPARLLRTTAAPHVSLSLILQLTANEIWLASVKQTEMLPFRIVNKSF